MIVRFSTAPMPPRGLGVALAALALAGCGATEGPPVPAGASDSVPVLATAFTNRLAGPDPVTQAIVLTQTVYPATREENAVGAIILSPQDEATAFTAMQRVTHMPVNAPLLYLERDGSLSERVKDEMRRLRPDGVVPDGQTQVYVVGDVDPAVAEEVRRELKLEVRRLYARDPVQLAELMDRWQAALKSDHPDEVVVSAVDHPDGIAHGIGAMGWNAHMGRGFGWVYRDSVPAATHRILSRRLGKAYIFITGGDDVVSEQVARELARYGVVRRIRGPNVFATNAVFAGYKDFGRNWGWWWDESPREFGWGIAQAGHNYIIGNSEDVLGLIPAAVLSHMGKHGPILLVSRDSVPGPTRDYLEMVQPDIIAAPDEAILNFAFIIGDLSRVSWGVQQELTRLLAPTRGDGGTGVILPALGGARSDTASMGER
jgi:hypothetical protein